MKKVGYLQNVSPMKMSQKKTTKYFNAVIQTTETDTEHIVSYKPEALKTFKEMSDAR